MISSFFLAANVLQVNNAGAIIPNAEGKRGLDVPVEELRAVMDLNLDR